MKKTDTAIALILGSVILGICVWTWIAPTINGDAHTHSENCSHTREKSDGDSERVCSENSAHDRGKKDVRLEEKKSGTRGRDDGHDHEHDHDHDHDSTRGRDVAHGHDDKRDRADAHDHNRELTEIGLTPNALKNLGLESEKGVLELQPGTFFKTHRIPAVIQGFEGRTTSKVPAPFAGLITKIYHEPGEAVHPGAALFDVTLSLPEMMDAQLALLKLFETREFLEREIAEIDENLNGLAPQRRRELDVRLKETLIDITNQKNRVRVLGLSEDALKQIESERAPLVHVVTVAVPPVSHEGIVSEQNPGEVKVFVVFEMLYVKIGQSVEVGETLCALSDLCELTARGEAFAINEGILLDALQNSETPIRVTFDGTGKAPLENLRLRTVESRIDEEARTLACFADFKNIVLDGNEPEPHTEEHPPRYVHWLYKPGQRCQMEIPYDTMKDVFIVPTGAVAQNIQETFVFELVEETPCGEKIWRRRPVHLLTRSKENAVLANDGDLPVGIRIAAQNAQLIQDAINAQSGSGAEIDPHAGHNH